MGATNVGLAAALEEIRSGSRVVAAMAAAEPQALLGALADRCATLKDVELTCANPSRAYACFTAPALEGRLDVDVLFLTPAVRRLQGHGRVRYVPQHLSQWARNLQRDRPVDVFWGSCSAPDARGFVSLGTGACYEPEILRAARRVILEVNPRMPVTAGATLVPLSWVHVLLDHPAELPETPRHRIDDTDRAIAAHVAGLIEDGSTVQFGIGGIPNALGDALRAKKDLGVHTEMINDAMMDLYLAGAVTGRRKTLWPGKIVGSFVYGTRALYDFVHQNPAVELQPSSVVNDPARIARNHRMVSVNAAVEVDLTGQVCAESIGHAELSGVGGAYETHVGAQRADGGRGIIALRATTAAGDSKIVFELRPGSKVSVSRNDVDTVVTEFGVARLLGRSVTARVKALIAVAHPRFREELTVQARTAGYL